MALRVSQEIHKKMPMSYFLMHSIHWQEKVLKNKCIIFQSVLLSVLPHVVRDELPESFIRQHTSVTWDELAPAQMQKLWDRFNSALLPAYQKNKLGVVVFQVMENTVKST